MSKRERTRERYPILNAFGNEHAFLDDAAALAATAEDRIRSIWPFIVSRVMAFHDTLKPRERVNFDPEDVLTELWVTLAEKNDQWTPDRGKYITYAGVIIDRELCAIRDKARTVQSPRNSTCRLKEYKAEEEAGAISAKRRKTANDIRRTSDGICPIATGSEGVDVTAIGSASAARDPVVEIIGSESSEEIREAIRTAVKGLPTFEALVLGSLTGLWGQPPRSIFAVSVITGRSECEIRGAKNRALARVRKSLVALDRSAS